MSLEPPPGLDPDCQLFLGDKDNSTLGIFNRVWAPAGGAVIGCTVVLAANLVLRRPVISGLQKYALYGALGAGGGEVLYHTRNRVLGEKDLQYYHYMTLHPEDFQAPERVKYKDYLTYWVPIR